MSRSDYVIGFGSNLGDRVVSLEAALDQLASLANLLTVSSLYETEPVGPPQPSFLNGAARVTSELAPLELLRTLLEIERRLGRVRRERWGPRHIDLDLLWSPGVAIHTVELALPHPELRRRRFALAPLVEVAPEARDPETGEPYRECLETLSDQALSVVAEGDYRFWKERVRTR